MRQTASGGGDDDDDGGGRGVASFLRGTSLANKLSLITLTVQTSAFILIMHHSRTMPPAGDHRYFPSTAVLLHEVIKLAVSLTLALYEASKTLAPSTPATVLFEQIFNATFSGDGWKLVVPAAFCTLHNILQYVAIGNLDAVHFQVLYQLKILTTAVFSVYLLNRPLALKRWLSLVLLTIGVSVVSLPSSKADPGLFHGMPTHFFPQYPRSKHELGHGAPLEVMPHLSKRSASYQGIDRDTSVPDLEVNYSLGVTAVLVAAAVSGLTGVYFDKVLKESPSQASVWIRNLQLGVYSLLTALVGGVIWQDGAGILEHGFFEGYNAVVWATVVLQAAGGIIASLVIRDTDNIINNFATSVSIVLSLVVSIYVFEFQATKTFFAGTSLVLLATYLYNSQEDSVMARKPMFLRIASFEKPAIESLLTPTGTPKHSDLKRLNTDPFNAKGLGMSTSRPNSPMVARSSTRLGREI